MKTITRVISTAAIAATAIGIAAGTASAATPAPNNPAPAAPEAADPHTLSTDILPGVHYTGNTADHSVVVTTPMGTLSSVGTAVQLQDSQGRTVFGRPFDTAPKAATTVQPQSATAQHVDAPAPHDKMADVETALGTAGTNIGLATGIGGMVGGVTGAVVGCPVGVVTGGTLTGVVSLGALTPIGAIGGCVAGASIVGSLGAIVGGGLVGIPVGIASGVQAYNTLHAQGDL